MYFKMVLFFRLSPFGSILFTVCLIYLILLVDEAENTYPNYFKSTLARSSFSEQYMYHYGCYYTDHSFRLGSVINASKPVWSHPVSALDIENMDNFNALMNHIRATIKLVFDTVLFNSVDDFLDFHNKYNEFITTSNSSVYDWFHRDFNPCFHNCGGHLSFQWDKLLNLIWYNMPRNLLYHRIFDHMYAASVDVLAPQSLLDSIGGEDETPRFKKMYHIMGILRFSLAGRLGFAVMDPGLDIPYPIIVMEDGMKPHTGEIMFEDKIINFITLASNKNYIYSKCNPAANLGDQSTLSMLIFAGHPFCSNKYFVQKPLLLEPYRSISKRDEMGHIVATVYFNAEAKFGKNKQGEEINLATVNIYVQETLSSNQTYITIPFEKFTNKDVSQVLKKEELDVINAANDLMKLKQDELLAKLVKVAITLQDIRFLRSIEDIKNGIRDITLQDAPKSKSIPVDSPTSSSQNDQDSSVPASKEDPEIQQVQMIPNVRQLVKQLWSGVLNFFGKKNNQK